MHVAHHLFKREQHRRHGRVEGRGDGRRSSHRQQSLYLFRTQTQVTAKQGGYAGPDLHRWAFAPEGNTTGESSCRAPELA